MDVFGKGTDEPSRPLLPPGICWICENSPQQEGMKVIDTRRNARAGGSMSHEAVRKYICEPCARECGQAVGLVDEGEHAELKRAHDDVVIEAMSLRERLEAAEAGQLKVVSADKILDAIREWQSAPSNTASAMAALSAVTDPDLRGNASVPPSK